MKTVTRILLAVALAISGLGLVLAILIGSAYGGVIYWNVLVGFLSYAGMLAVFAILWHRSAQDREDDA